MRRAQAAQRPHLGPSRWSNPHHKRAMLLIPTVKAKAMKLAAEERAFETTEEILTTIGANRCDYLIEELKALRQAIDGHTRKQVSKSRSTDAAKQPTMIPMALFGMLN